VYISPDEKYILVNRYLRHGSELWRFPPTGGPGEKLYFFLEGGYGFVLNPTDDRMVWLQTKMSQELWVLENFFPK
jgi:hypothetical protein